MFSFVNKNIFRTVLSGEKSVYGSHKSKIIYRGGRNSRSSNSIFIQNRTVFGSVFHIDFSLLVDYEGLKEDMMNSLMMGGIKLFIESYFNLLYSIWFKIFKLHFKIKKSVVDCFTSITGNLENMLVDVLPSLTIWCSFSDSIRQKFALVDLNYVELTKVRLGQTIHHCAEFHNGNTENMKPSKMQAYHWIYGENKTQISCWNINIR